MKDMKLNLLINITPLSLQRSGIGNYIENLICLLNNSGLFNLTFLNNGKRTKYNNFNPNNSNNVLYQIKKKIKNRGADCDWLRNLYFKLKEVLAQTGSMFSSLPDELYHETHYYPFNISRPTITTIYDLSMMLYPKLHEASKILEFNRLSSRILNYSDRIHTISQSVKNEIIKYSNYDPEKIDVIYPVISPIYRKISDLELSRFKKKAGITSKYILHVGTLEPRKNIPNLLRAYEIIKRKHKWDGKLMLIGEKGWDYESIFETARTLKIYKDIIFTDYISISELPFYYCGAEIFTYSSIYEGFGMPCLEAIRCKSKIAVSDIPSLRESTNDQAIYFDPFDPVEMAEKIFKGLNKNSSSYIENPVFSNESIFNEILLSYKKLGLGY